MQYILRGMRPEEPFFPIPATTHERKGISPADVLRSFHLEHYVREAPRLGDIAADESRSTPFYYYPTTGMTRRQRFTDGEVGNAIVLTEHEGLGALQVFLATTMKDIQEHGESTQIMQAIEIIATRTSFIGAQELEEAANGIALLWKEYLAANSKNQLVVPEGIIGTGEGIAKSSDFLFERIMHTFNPTEQAVYAARIIRTLNHLHKNPAYTKIVLLDDWTIS